MGVKIEEILLFSSVVMAGLSLLLLVVSLFSFSRLKTSKFLFVTIAFFLFLVKGIAIAIQHLEQQTELVIIDLFIIFFLYLTIVKK